MGDRRVSLFGANYRLFSVGVLLGCKAVPYPAPTAPNLLIKHSHLHFGHSGNLDCSTETPSLVVTTAGRESKPAERAAARVMSKVWMTVNKRNPEHFKLGSTFSIVPKIRGVTLTIGISGQTQLTLIGCDSHMKLSRQNIQHVWFVLGVFFCFFF